MPKILLFILVVITTTQVANLLTTIYLHRYLSHRAFELARPLEQVIRFILWLTTTINRLEWVAVHRKHHAFSDQEGDPHSPILKGFWKVQLGNLIYYRREARNEETVAKYSKDIKADWFDRIDGWWLSFLCLAVIFVAILGPIWGVAAVLAHYAFYIFLSATINGAGHWYGYRHYDNKATNLWIVSLLTGGEGLHNNHHAFPGNAKFRQRWWEIDFGWMVIKLMSYVGLSHIRQPQAS